MKTEKKYHEKGTTNINDTENNEDNESNMKTEHRIEKRKNTENKPTKKYS